MNRTRRKAGKQENRKTGKQENRLIMGIHNINVGFKKVKLLLKQAKKPKTNHLYKFLFTQ
ncbi:hypothetical protein A9G34_07545 [Gilliamella sp. Choc4-2]|nr:hypothetical protein A9G34_07545 [Gilliamella apicola]